MSFSRKVLIGLVAGGATGLFLGELVAPLKILADGFVKLLQMTVLPYVTISIISSLGSLNFDEAKRLGLRAGAVLAGLWIVALGFAFLFPLVFPHVENATFFSTTLVERRPAFNFVDLYIPSNPFYSLANNIVPAVVLFSVILGVALIGVDRKGPLIDLLTIANAAVSRATRFVVQLTPYGIFAIAATAAGTLDIEQLGRIEVYLVAYMAFALVLSLGVLPGLVSALTPIRFGEVAGATRDALITAFVAGDLFIVLPILTEQCKQLLERHRVTDAHTATLPEVLIPASFNFPHTGKLLSLSFVLFAGWFADASVPASEYPRLAITGLLTFFGSLNAAVPFLLDLFRIPADTFQLFLATAVINSRFGSLVAAVHTVTIGLIGSAAIVGAIRFDAGRLLRFAVTTLLLTAVTVLGLRTLFATVLRQEFAGAEIVYQMRPLLPEAQSAGPEESASGAPAGAQVPVLDRIRVRGAVRVCVLPERLPYAFRNRQGKLVGLDVEMANALARDLQVRLAFVPSEINTLPGLLVQGTCEIAMAGTPVTPDRASTMRFSQPYLDETLAFVVKDHLREQFASWSAIRALGHMPVGMPDVDYLRAILRSRAPDLQLEPIPVTGKIALAHVPDAFVLPAERGSVYTLLHPAYSVVVPEPDIVKVPLAYPLAPDPGWETFVNTWIELKRRDETIDSLYRHWILGEQAAKHPPRWSVIRNVLHWID